MSMKTTRCQRPPKGRQRQHVGMNDEYLSNEDVYATGGRSAQIISARTGVESRTLKGKEQLGVRGKLGILFALHLLLCSAICSRHTPDDKLYLTYLGACASK